MAVGCYIDGRCVRGVRCVSEICPLGNIPTLKQLHSSCTPLYQINIKIDLIKCFFFAVFSLKKTQVNLAISYFFELIQQKIIPFYLKILLKLNWYYFWKVCR